MKRYGKWLMLLVLCIGSIIMAIGLSGCGMEDLAEEAGSSGSAGQAEQTEQAGTYEIQITGDEDNEAAVELLALVNEYRSEQGMDALGWNDAPAEMLRVRAAELALDFSETRLDGTPGEEMLRLSCDGVEEGADQLLQDEGFVGLMEDSANKSFCAGVFQSYSGRTYVAAGVYADAGAEAPSGECQERTFTLTATDDALNCRGELLDQEMEPEDPQELYQGEGYYYCIFNENASDENNVEELVSMVAGSSDPEVVTIDEFGEVTAKGTGTATLTVRPAEDSAIVFEQEVRVRE